MVCLGKLPQLWVIPNDHPDTSRVKPNILTTGLTRIKPRATAFKDCLHTSSTVDVHSYDPPTRSFKDKGQKINELRFVYAIVTTKTPATS